MEPTHRASAGRHRRPRARSRHRGTRVGALPALIAALVLVSGGIAMGTLGAETPTAPTTMPVPDPPTLPPDGPAAAAAEGSVEGREGPADDSSGGPDADADSTDAADPAPPSATVPPTVIGPDREAASADELAPEEIPTSGSGAFRVARVPDARRAAPSAEWTYTVEVEDGLPFDVTETARVVDEVLGDPRGWTGHGDGDFARVAGGSRIRVLVASPDTTDRLCAPLRTNGQVSCRNGALVVLNARRWAFGTEDYAGRLGMYRTYLVNHEVGHALGYGHVACPAPGEPAPVMMQQTYGLDGCARNVWPTTG